MGFYAVINKVPMTFVLIKFILSYLIGHHRIFRIRFTTNTIHNISGSNHMVPFSPSWSHFFEIISWLKLVESLCLDT